MDNNRPPDDINTVRYGILPPMNNNNTNNNELSGDVTVCMYAVQTPMDEPGLPEYKQMPWKYDYSVGAITTTDSVRIKKLEERIKDLEMELKKLECRTSIELNELKLKILDIEKENA